MKKLLVLLLVLGMTGASYGALTDFDLDLAGGTLTVVGLNSVALNYGVYEEGIPSQGTFAAPTAILSDGSGGMAGGALSIMNLVVAWNGFDMMTGDSTPASDAVDVMDWFTIAYNGSVGDVMTIYDYAVSATVPIGTKVVIPEPISIALLGLGGLFLRRRK